MPNNHQAELDALAKQLRSTQLLLEKIAKKNELSKMIELIRARKGWTTIAEMAFAKSSVEGIRRQLKNLDASVAELVEAAALVK